MLETFRGRACAAGGMVQQKMQSVNGSSANLVNILTLSFISAKATGGNAYPTHTRVSRLSFPQSIQIFGITLTSSIVNATATSIKSVLLALDQGPTFDISVNPSNIFLVHMARTNSLITSSPSNRTSSIFYPVDRPLPFNSNQSLALYSNSDSQATDFVDAVATIYYIPIGI